MTLLFFLISLGLAIAFAVLQDRVGALRSQMEELREAALDRIRLLERRMELLEKAGAEQRTPAEEAPVAQGTPERERVSEQAADSIAGSTPEKARTAEPAVMASPLGSMPAWIAEGAGTNAISAEPVAAPEFVSVTAPAFAATHAPESGFHSLPSDEETKVSLSLEERLGSNWLAKLGVSILVIGVAFFLAPRLLTMGPVGKSLTGLAVSFALLGGGLWLERKPVYRIFARAGIGGGWALLFFTTYAMHHLAATRVIDSLVLDLLLMLLVAAGMVAHSLRYSSETATGLAFLLAFATVATSHLEAADGTIVFSLVASAVLAAGLAIVTTRRHWARLELAGLIAVMGNHFLWLALVMPAMGGKAGFPLFWQSTGLILFYWALFRATYLLRVPLDDAEERISSLSAIVAIGGVLGLLKFQSAHPEWTFRALVAMGSVEMVLGFWARRRRKTAFLVLTTIATVLLVAAVPYQFHGVSWPVLWLVEAHVLALCGLRLGEPIFRKLGLLAGFGASLVLLAKVFVLATFRLEYPDAARHLSLAIGLGLAAALFWVHGEVYQRLWPGFAAGLADWERWGLAATSWLGLGAAAAAIWVVLPSAWAAIGWLGLVIALGILADRHAAVSLALQADALAAAAIVGLFGWDFAGSPVEMHKLPSGLAIALLYAGTRRRTVLENSPRYVAGAYSWAASLLLLGWIGKVVEEQWLVLAWVGVAFALLELGRRFQKGYLRWQGYVTAAVCLSGLEVRWFEQAWAIETVHGWFPMGGTLTWSAVVVVTLLYWLQERTRIPFEAGSSRQFERNLGVLAGALATLVVATWLPTVTPSWDSGGWGSVSTALFASTLLGVALLARRGVFQLHGMFVALGVGLWGVGMVVEGAPVHANLQWYQGVLFQQGLSAAILLSGMLFAFPLRKVCASDPAWRDQPAIFERPEKWFFFVPFGLMVVTLAAELRPGSLTLGWSLLGLGAFVLALPLGERSFRLAGLGLLLLCVAKVLLMDVWTFQPTDRYITLIGMGCALLAVSFLYTRFREFLRRYL